MNILLGFRLAFAGGREALARMMLMLVGVTIGVPLILFAISAVPIMQAHMTAWPGTAPPLTARPRRQIARCGSP